MRFIKVLLLLVLFVFGLLFFVQNSEELGFVQAPAQTISVDGAPVTAGKTLTLGLDLYFMDLKWQSPSIPLYVVILASFAVGMLFATLLLLIDRIRLGCALVSRKRAVRSLEKEVERLKAGLPKTAQQTGAPKETKVIETKTTQVRELPQAAQPAKA